MTDILIRNVPEKDVARLDELARTHGLSRTDYLRRQLHAEAQRSVVRVTMQDVRLMTELVADLGDPEIMDQAWS